MCCEQCVLCAMADTRADDGTSDSTVPLISAGLHLRHHGAA
jgi:hypothetical protein